MKKFEEKIYVRKFEEKIKVRGRYVDVKIGLYQDERNIWYARAKFLPVHIQDEIAQFNESVTEYNSSRFSRSKTPRREPRIPQPSDYRVIDIPIKGESRSYAVQKVRNALLTRLGV